jgi:hypothetical protein
LRSLVQGMPPLGVMLVREGATTDGE